MARLFRSLPRHLLWLLALSSTPYAWSEGGTLRVGLMHTEPWAFYSQDGREGSGDQKSQLTGIFVDMNREIARETHLNLETSTLPYGRINKELQSGETDLTYLIRSGDRDAYVDYAGLLFSFHSIVLARPGTPLRSYEDLRGLRIGILKDIRLNPRFDGDGELHKVEVRDYETLVHMFLGGRLDAVAGNSVSLPYLLQKRGFAVQSLPKLTLQKTEVWAQMSRRSSQSAMLPRLRAAIDKLRSDGLFEAVLQRYHPTRPEESTQAKRSIREVSSTGPVPGAASPMAER